MDKFLVKKKPEGTNVCTEPKPSSSRTNFISCAGTSREPVPDSEKDNVADSEKDNTENLASLETIVDKKRPPSFKRWQLIYPWLRLNSDEKAICAICVEAVEKKLHLSTHHIRFSPARDTYVTKGFSCWKNAILSFKKHENSEFHRRATEAVANTKKPSVIQSISDKKRKEMMDARVALEKIFSIIDVLARQGLALRGSQNDESSNLTQILKMRAEDVPELNAWLILSSYKWLHHDTVNEILELMSKEVIRNIVTEIKSAQYFALIVDETSDISRLEQVSISIRIVSRDLGVKEMFIGFYETANTSAETLFAIIQDVLARLDLDISELRGQCFDGASNVSGRISGLQARIREVEPRAVYVHYAAHTLNLVVQDAMERVDCARNFIGIAKDLLNFIRDSPKRLAAFKNLQSEKSPNLSPFCPTRWCMRIKSLKTLRSMINYETALSFFEGMTTDKTIDSSVFAKASGFLRQLGGFDFLFLLTCTIVILERVEVLNAELQRSDLSVNESHQKVILVIESLEELRVSGFKNVSEMATVDAEQLGLEKPQLPRVRRAVQRLISDDRNRSHTFSNPEEYFRKKFFEIIDQVLTSMKDRFSSATMQLLNKFEDFAVGRESSAEVVTSFYQQIQHKNGNPVARADFDAEQLTLHQKMFLGIARQRNLNLNSLKDVVSFFKENSSIGDLLPEFLKFFRIILTNPASSCTAERSFSALRRLKTYLRSSMLQSRLNHIAILYIHSEMAEEINRDLLINEFINRNVVRKATSALLEKSKDA